MLRNVPTGTSCFLGTTAVSTISPERRTNFTWLPFWPASTKPAASSRRLISRKGCGLSRPNLDLNHADGGQPRGHRRFEVQFQGLLQISQSFLFGLALACDIDLQALRDVPLPLAPNSRCERSLHYLILSQARALCAEQNEPLNTHLKTGDFDGVRIPLNVLFAAGARGTPLKPRGCRRPCCGLAGGPEVLRTLWVCFTGTPRQKAARLANENRRKAAGESACYFVGYRRALRNDATAVFAAAAGFSSSSPNAAACSGVVNVVLVIL